MMFDTQSKYWDYIWLFFIILGGYALGLGIVLLIEYIFRLEKWHVIKLYASVYYGLAVIALVTGASFHGYRMNPENAAHYNIGVTMGITMITSFVVFLVTGTALAIIGKRNKSSLEVTGKYEIGCKDYWVTEDREETFLHNGSLRELQVRIWYPKNYDNQNKKRPVVVASHGSCGTIDNNLSLYREFASHGYVVLAVGHPGHAFSVLHSNGKKQKVSMDYMKQMSGIDPQKKLNDAAGLFKEWMKIRKADLDFVINDCKKRTVKEPDYFKSADTSRFVTLGHSAGGSAALGMARIRKDVVGVIAIEAPCMYDIKGVKDGEYIIDDSDCLKFLQRM